MLVSRCHRLLWLATLGQAGILSPRDLRSRLLNHNYYQDGQIDQQYLSAESPVPLECFQVTHPIETHQGLAIGNHIVEPKPSPAPSTTIRLVEHSFGNSYGKPFVGHYEPPETDFSRVFINVTVTSRGHQFDRLATMWLGDVEIWRTSTAEPTQQPGIVWYFLKDMTTYHKLWRESQIVIFDLGNLINEKYTAPFNVTVDAVFFDSQHDKQPVQTLPPADLILPVSAQKSEQGSPSAFTFPGDAAEASIQVPRNAGTVVLSVAATGQAGEEFWWSNVPEVAAGYFDYTDGEKLPGLSSFREVRVYIDDHVAGLAWPFPVVFTGGIAPPLHRPNVGLQAFDMREYEIDLTPWIGMLSDGQEHIISLKVFGVSDTDPETPEFVYAGSHWVLSGKVFVWLSESDVTSQEPPEVYINPNDYKSGVSFLSKSALDYKQSITRQYLVRSRLLSSDSREVSWSQKYAMNNDGAMRDSGYYQDVNASYAGFNFGQEDGRNRLTTQFEYPINTTYHYQVPKEPGHLELEAVLAQELSLGVSLDSPFVTGAEPFIDNEISIGSSWVYARRIGHATFTQDSGRSSGAGHTDLHYRLSASNLKSGVLGSEHRSLYERSTSVTNETVNRDEESLRGRKLEQPVWERSHNTGMASEFAPLPLNQLGGVNVFLRP